MPWVMLRMMEYLSACLASSGSSSPIRMPSTLVAMRLVQRAAVVVARVRLRIERIEVDGPPHIQIWMTALALASSGGSSAQPGDGRTRMDEPSPRPSAEQHASPLPPDACRLPAGVRAARGQAEVASLTPGNGPVHSRAPFAFQFASVPVEELRAVDQAPRHRRSPQRPVAAALLRLAGPAPAPGCLAYAAATSASSAVGNRERIVR